MPAEDAIRVILGVSIGTSAVFWIYFRTAARRNSFLVFSTMNGAVPVVATWAWAVPFLVIMTVTVFRPSLLRWAMIDVPGWVRTCGAIAVLPVPLICLWVLRYLGNNFTGAFAAVFSQKLVTRGPYRYMRHPLYALECYFLLSLAFATANWIVLGYACSGILTIRLAVIPHEEAYLTERFGKIYREYRKKTGAMFPSRRRMPLPKVLKS